MKDKDYGFKWLDLSKGDRYILNESSYSCLWNSEYPSFQADDIWLDIGANFGSFAIRVSPMVHRVIAVEPFPGNLDKLYSHIEMNDVKNITVVPAAVIGRPDQEVNLALGHTFDYTHRVGTVRGRENMPVQGFNINGLITRHFVNKIKMDCEGSEDEILEDIDYSGIDEIIMEWHFTLIPDHDWTKMRKAIKKLTDNGFAIARMPKGDPTKRWTAIIWAVRP